MANLVYIIKPPIFVFVFFVFSLFCFSKTHHISTFSSDVKTGVWNESNKHDIADIFDAYFSRKGNSLPISLFNKFSKNSLLYVSPYLLLW